MSDTPRTDFSALGAELQWNSEADEYNQWDALGQDERDQLVADFITANPPVLKQKQAFNNQPIKL